MKRIIQTESDDDFVKIFGPERLLEKIIKPFCFQVLAHIWKNRGGERDSGNALVYFLNFNKRFISVHHGHIKVNQNQVIRVASKQLYSFLPVCCLMHLHFPTLQEFPGNSHIYGAIFSNKYANS